MPTKKKRKIGPPGTNPETTLQGVRERLSQRVGAPRRGAHPGTGSDARLFLLPWPPAVLSPNDRSGWRVKRATLGPFRRICKLAVEEQMTPVPDWGGRPLRLTLRFAPPDHRSYDRDNLLARCKGALDGMCDALGIDDALFDSVLLRPLAEPIRRGLVFATIETDPDHLALAELLG